MAAALVITIISAGSKTSGAVLLPPFSAAPEVQRGCAQARAGLAFYRQRYRESRAKMGAGRLTTSAPSARRDRACPHIRHLAERWREKAHAARLAFVVWFSETYKRWRCIHEHEGSWDDPDPLYFGGLQMSYDFQQAHGPEFLHAHGTADRWPVWMQLVVAERARKRLGFAPWPTRKYCGL